MPSVSAAEPAAVQAAFRAVDRKRRKPWSGEEEVRLAWVAALESATGFDFDAERKRKDSSYNNVIIEFKGPGLFRGSQTSPKFREATQERLLPYITRAAKDTGIAASDFIGIAIDGEHVCFCQVVEGRLEAGHLLPFSLHSMGMVVAACLSSTRRAVTSENLIQDFGHVSPVAVAVMQVLSDALAKAVSAKTPSKVRMLFEEWKDLYGQVADMSNEQAEAVDRALRFDWNGPNGYAMPARLFVIHTYNSLLIKLLAAEIVAAHGLTTLQAPAESMCAVLTPAKLIKALDIDIEQGGLFAGAGILGFVEEAIFSWHLDVSRDAEFQAEMVASIKALLGRLALYRTDRLERQRDTLRDFYQDLVPQTLRKSLGEFYTPDWLVDFTLSKAVPGAVLGKRFLDPACGSGSFLIALIRRKRSEATAQGLNATDTLLALRKEVWGFDLNPLAVQTTRVNYLMEVADLLAQVKGSTIELPVLLADAIYSPAAIPIGAEPVVSYKIGSQVASLNVLLPTELAFNRERLDKVFEAMGESVEADQEFEVARRAMVAAAVLSKGEAEEWTAPLKATYNQVLALHRKNWNGIWFRIVRNFFWSATAGKFDVVVGNPPWVRWSKLPEAYRERVKPTCEQYDIFARTTYHGGNELDISAMMTYTTGDKWLKDGGTLAFVITQTVFQNPSSAGFRNFRIDGTSHLVPARVDDLKAMKPFQDAANKTAVAVFKKTAKPPVYPVTYTVWGPGSGMRSIPPSLSLEQVLSQVTRTEMEANPVADEGSPWAILPPGRFQELRPLSLVEGAPWVEGRKGITVDLNGVYFVGIHGQNATAKKVQVRSRPEAGKKDIGPAQTRWIEPDWLYPLIKGASDFEPCYLCPRDELFAIVPNKGIRKADFAAAEKAWAKLPLTKAYLRRYEALLRSRSTWKGRMAATGAPFYSVYNVGDFTFKPWKVIWAEMSGAFSAAVAGLGKVPLVGRRPYVPDHKIFFVAFDDKAEAHYLCGILNAPAVTEYVDSHNVAIQVGDIFKHMRLPQFDGSAQHRKLADLVEAAHAEPNATARHAIVSEVRQTADKVIQRWLQRKP